MPLAPSKRTLAEDSCPPCDTGRKIGAVEMALVWNLLHADPACPSRVVLDKSAQRQAPIAVSVRHLNRLRVRWHLNRKKGRPRQAAWSPPVASDSAVVQVTPRLACVGVHLLVHWLDQHEGFAPVVTRLQQAIEAYQSRHPDEDFALLHHCEQTLRQRFQALFFAPLVGIETLTGVDTHEHPLRTLVGRGYPSSTVTQFLGHLERLNAAEALLPALLPATGGQSTYVDGHMIAYWARVPMHKGQSTRLGRIMAGSQALIAHNEAGHALFVAYYPPDMHLSQIIRAYCQQVVAGTGTPLFVIARAVNAVAIARAFAHQGWGLLSMLDDTEQQGLASFDATAGGTLADGTPVYSGQGKVPRPDDPRHFVIGEPSQGQTVVYGGTAKVKAALEAIMWPRGYQQRSEMPENSCKRMSDHGALQTNYGRKKILGTDRHRQRETEQLDKAWGAAHKRLDQKAQAVKTQQAKVAESASTGHKKRLEQRQRALAGVEQEWKDAKPQHDKLAEQAAAFGSPGERADRDFRTQTLMTLRTLRLENAVMAFMVLLCERLQAKVSLDWILKSLFERSGARMETASQVVYWVNTAGLSVSYQRRMTEVVAGLWAMDLRYQGKPLRVRLKDMSP